MGKSRASSIAVDSNASVGHPSLSKDDKILYFAGELTQGVGGKDIFMTTYDEKREWEEAQSRSVSIQVVMNYIHTYTATDTSTFLLTVCREWVV